MNEPLPLGALSAPITGEHPMPVGHCSVCHQEHPSEECKRWARAMTRGHVKTFVATWGYPLLGGLLTLSVTACWYLVSRSDDAHASALVSHESREQQFHGAQLEEMKLLRGDIKEVGRRMDRYLGPLSPTPAVREPNPP